MLKILYYKGSKATNWCLWLLHNTVYTVMLLMSEVLKVYSVYSGLSYLLGGKAI